MMHQLLDGDFRIVNICTDGVAALCKIVRSHIRSHTDSNTRSTVQKKKRKLRRKNGRLLKGVIEVILKIYSILVKVCKNLI